MLKFIKRWFEKKPIIDRIIEFTDPRCLMIWNGVDNQHNYCIPLTSRKPHTWNEENFQWLRLAFGRYDSTINNESMPMIEIWINAYGRIVRTSRNRPLIIPRIFRHRERQLDKLYDILRDEQNMKTNIPKLADWIGGLFSIKPNLRYRNPIEYRDILGSGYPELDYILEQLSKEN